MKFRKITSTLAALSCCILIPGFPIPAHAQNDVVTYQGRVQSGGSDFTGTGQFKFALVTSSNTSVQATATATTSGGFVTIINITGGGGIYVTPPAVTIIGGGGAGATATAGIGGGAVTNIMVTNAGNGGYTSAPTVLIEAPPESLLFTTYWSNDGTSVDGSEPADTVSLQVNEGLFTVRLGDATLVNMTDLSAGLFAQPDLELRIWFDDGVNGFAVLSPTQPLTAAPYALEAANAMTVAMGTVSDPSFIGTTTTAPLEFWVNNQVGLRLENSTAGIVPNLIGGSSDNSVGAGTEGAVIAGGQFNDIGLNANYSAIGGGLNNGIASNSFYATIAGGNGNDIGADSDYCAIGGGFENNIADNSFYATIAGGNNNYIASKSTFATIAGGTANGISVDSDYSAIGGGNNNNIASNSFVGTIAGGTDNDIGVNADYNAIGGGRDNNIASNSSHATIAGGQLNNIDVNADHSAIGGGLENNISSNSLFAVIPGGRGNDVGPGASYAFAAGRRAQANHQGAFAWADSQNADFASTANNQFLIRASGGVGIGTSSPQAEVPNAGLRVAGAGHVVVDNNFGVFSVNAATNGIGAGIDTTPTDALHFFAAGAAKMVVNPDGNVGIGLTGPTEKLHVVGNILATGTITPSSDRNLKKNFAAVDAREVLERVASLPLQQWTYKAEENSVRHVGPMAQDFHAAFGLGANDTTIATVDADGVALAAIQGLNEKVESGKQKAETRMAILETENAELKHAVNELEVLVNTMNHKLNGGEL